MFMGVISTTTTPFPLKLKDPSTYSSQCRINCMDYGGDCSFSWGDRLFKYWKCLSWISFLKEYSIVRSVKACSLITSLVWYKSPYSYSSIDHITNCPNMYSLWRVYHRGYYINIITWWAWNYDFSFLEVLTKVRAIFSTFKYIILASLRVQ